jgi:hypothetical protein
LAGWAIAALLLAAGPLDGQGPAEKLTTVLADWAGAIERGGGPRPASPTGADAPGGPGAGAAGLLPASVEDAITTRSLRVDARGHVQVYVLVDEVTTERLAALEDAGAAVEVADAPARRVQARVPPGRLRAVASLGFVTFVRLPDYARPAAGAVRTEGDAIHLSDVARAEFGVDGAGVRVGVISDGIRGVFDTNCTMCGALAGGALATGDLPASVGTRTAGGTLVTVTGGMSAQSFQAGGDLEDRRPPSQPCAFEGAGAEGTALAEIVHDVAPGARLAFANAGTSLEFNAAVNALSAANDVVVDDLSFFGEPADGRSLVSTNTAAALNLPANRIRTYVTSAGNAADNHYFGPFVDSGVEGRRGFGIATRGRLHRFERTGDTSDVLGRGAQPYNLIALPKGGEVIVVVTWDDPRGRSGNNYDVFLVRESSEGVVARSVDAQRGGQDPIEVIDYVNRGDAGLFRLLVQNVDNAAAPRALNVFAFQPQCAAGGPLRLDPNQVERLNFNTPSRSLAAQSDAGGSPASVISVGAICSASAAAAAAFQNANPSCNDRTRTTIEFFSSRGPTLDGRLKPEIAAVDGVAVTGSGGFPSTFFGTSAAAPHVAGMAALALSAAPCLLAGEPGALPPDASRLALREALLGGADPLGTPAPNFVFGFGRANALNAVRRAQAACASR